MRFQLRTFFFFQTSRFSHSFRESNYFGNLPKISLNFFILLGCRKCQTVGGLCIKLLTFIFSYMLHHVRICHGLRYLITTYSSSFVLKIMAFSGIYGCCFKLITIGRYITMCYKLQQMMQRNTKRCNAPKCQIVACSIVLKRCSSCLF